MSIDPVLLLASVVPITIPFLFLWRRTLKSLEIRTRNLAPTKGRLGPSFRSLTNTHLLWTLYNGLEIGLVL